jgi:hypothetical protein
MLFSHNAVRAVPVLLVGMTLFLFGYRAQHHGAQDDLHRMVDWSRMTEEGRKLASAFTGTILYLMALLILGIAAWMASGHRLVGTWLILLLGVPVIAIGVALKVGLQRYAKRYPASTADPHERR